MSTNPWKSLDARLLGEIYASDESMQTVRALCDRFGHRFAGTDAERRAAEFLVERLRACGLTEARIEPFDYLGWRRGRPARLSVLSPVKRTIPCIALPYCPPTGARGLEAELLDLGDGSPLDFAQNRARIRGRFVMANSKPLTQLGRWVHRVEKYGRAVGSGARGFFFANHYDGLLAPTGALRFGLRAEIPGVGLAKEHAAALARLAESGPVKLRLLTADRFAPTRGRNVLAELPGHSSREIVLVGGHYDGHDISVGAGDNAAGVAAVLEALRALAASKANLPFTIRVALWSAEEIGLLGSHAYVKQHRRELKNVRLYLNVDGLPAERAKGVVTCGWPELKPFVQEVSRQMCYAAPFGDQVNAHSDHYSFFLAGVPAAGLGNIEKPFEGRGYGHTAADTLDKVELRELQESAAVLARLLVRFASAERWPLRHHDRRWVLRQLKVAGLVEAMKLERSAPFSSGPC